MKIFSFFRNLCYRLIFCSINCCNCFSCDDCDLDDGQVSNCNCLKKIGNHDGQEEDEDDDDEIKDETDWGFKGNYKGVKVIRKRVKNSVYPGSSKIYDVNCSNCETSQSSAVISQENHLLHHGDNEFLGACGGRKHENGEGEVRIEDDDDDYPEKGVNDAKNNPSRLTESKENQSHINGLVNRNLAEDKEEANDGKILNCQLDRDTNPSENRVNFLEKTFVKCIGKRNQKWICQLCGYKNFNTCSQCVQCERRKKSYSGPTVENYSQSPATTTTTSTR